MVRYKNREIDICNQKADLFVLDLVRFTLARRSAVKIFRTLSFIVNSLQLQKKYYWSFFSSIALYYMVIQLRTLEDDNLDFKISDKELQITVLNMIKSLHGDFGAGAIKTCFKVRYCNPTTKILIFKTRHGPHQFLSSVIPFINKLQEKQIQLSTLYTGASMFQCYKFIQNYQKDLVRKMTDIISEKTKEKMLNITNVANF